MRTSSASTLGRGKGPNYRRRMAVLDVPSKRLLGLRVPLASRPVNLGREMGAS
jgi:hypothetical protein